MTKVQPETDLAEAEAKLIEAGLDLQEQSLNLLKAEMQALASLMPGIPVSHPTEEETEAGFDNLPV